MNKLGSTKEIVLAGGTPLIAGTLVVNATTNLPVVVPANETAAQLATALGVSTIKNIDLPARTGQYADKFFGIFET